MKILILTSSPNSNGLTSACGEAARQGVIDSRSPARVVNLNDLSISRCAVHNDGWGTCHTKYHCQLEDDFQNLQDTIEKAEGYVFITPVYFGEPSEPMKAMIDRLRRCEATKDESTGEKSILAKKPAVLVAAAGGTGHGTLSCLEMLERFALRVGVKVFDTIPVTKNTRDYQLETIHDALAAMAAAPPIPEMSPAKRRERHPTRRHRRRS
ncbi:MAG TPA: flavodoxin family protein [Candidatus Acetothermia bacterium]|nr:flavodoxin family protein [Candidatus Acetothermia bacterium]